MKRLLLFIILLLGCLNNTYAQWATYTPTVSQRNLSQIILEDGYYNAQIEYQSSTGHNARYTLKVQVIRDCVTAIIFEDGGYIHKGANNSEYTYEGGGIEFNTSFDGQIIGATARIKVTYYNGSWQYFWITL